MVRWRNAKPTQEGTERIMKHFAFLPVTCYVGDGQYETRWLENVEYIQKYKTRLRPTVSGVYSFGKFDNYMFIT